MRKTVGLLLAAVTVISVFAWAGEKKDVIAFRHRQEQKMQAYVAQQQDDELRFRERLKGMPPAGRARAIAEHRAERQAKNEALSEQLHRENVAFLKAHFLKQTQLTEAEKEELVACLEQQYAEEAVFRLHRYETNAAFFEKTANDPSLSLAQKKARLREHFEAQRTENWREENLPRGRR